MPFPCRTAPSTSARRRETRIRKLLSLSSGQGHNRRPARDLSRDEFSERVGAHRRRKDSFLRQNPANVGVIERLHTSFAQTIDDIGRNARWTRNGKPCGRYQIRVAKLFECWQIWEIR